MSARIDPSDLSFRVATSRDAAAIETLVQLAYRGGKASVSWKNESHLVKGQRITEKEVVNLLNRPETSILVAELDAVIVACVQVEKHADEAHIGLLAVNPDCQNLGLGKKMLARAERHGMDHFHCATAAMFVLSGRDELLNWYLSLGYKMTGRTEPFHGPHTQDSGQVALGENPHLREIQKPLAVIDANAVTVPSA